MATRISLDCSDFEPRLDRRGPHHVSFAVGTGAPSRWRSGRDVALTADPILAPLCQLAC